MLNIRHPAKLENLPEFIRPLSGWFQLLGFSEQQVIEIELVLEEALVNIFSYAYPGEKGAVEIECRHEEGRQFVIEITDRGIPFNMLATEDPDLTAGILERKVGGMGVFLIKKLADRYQYRRIGDVNRLSLTITKATEDQK